MKKTLFIEGGATKGTRGAKKVDLIFRNAWRKFFVAAGITRLPRVSMSGGREQAFEKFCESASRLSSNHIPILLVDSEQNVAPKDSAWEHLHKVDGWHKPESVSSNQTFLMAQCMETWFVSDVRSLKKYFGRGFSRKSFRSWRDLESVPKRTILQALRAASRKSKRRYAKGEASFRILESIDPRIVEQACPHCAELLNHLRDSR